MNKNYNLLGLVVLLLATAMSHPLRAQTWQLVWQDEFTNGISADWVFETGTGVGGWGNNELQYYRQENATVENGQLVITAKRENVGGMAYTSARMKTQGKKSWRYGRIEARIAMPSFQGVWPAFWMLGDNITTPGVGWPACGEIDIMEHVNTGNQVYGTVHWSDNNNQYASYGGNTNAGSITAYHTYSIEWNANTIKWFLDGVQYHIIDITNGVNGTSEFHNNFFILLNMAIGGNWPGFTVDNNGFPAKMYVDYVRVYQPVSTYSVTLQAENYGSMSGVQTEACTDTGGGLNVGWIDANDWMAYSSVNFPTSGAYTIEYRVASLNGGGRLSADLNAGSIVLGTRDIPATGGWQNWTTVSHTVNVNAGTYNFGIFAQAGGWNLNWIRITKQASAAAASTLATESMAATETNVLELYPNPATGSVLNLRTSADLEGAAIKVLDRAGLTVLTAPAGTRTVDVSSLPAGFYTLVMVKNGRTVSRHFSR